MVLYLSTVTLILFSFFYNSETNKKISLSEAESMAFQIRNFHEFTTEEKKLLIFKIHQWENKSDVFNLNDSERLPHSLINLTVSPTDFKPIESSPFIKKPVCWIPDINLFYEIMLVNKKMKILYGEEKCPTMHMIMALLSHETYMREIKGDNNLSVGMCQLYKPSASYILNYSPNREIFKNLIYFDEDGEHQFYSRASMLEFVHHFLILEKGFTNLQKRTGIAAYNGGGERADNYAKSVLMKSMFYEALCTKLKASSPEEAISKLKDWSKQPLNTTFIGFNGFTESAYSISNNKHLSENEINTFLTCKYSLTQYVSEIKQTYLHKPIFFNSDMLSINVEIKNHIYPSASFKKNKYLSNLNDSNFFIIQPKCSVYSYLKENTFHVMTNYNNYYFYYIENGEKEIILSEAMVKQKFSEGKIILSNAIAGDTVYVPVNTTVYQ